MKADTAIDRLPRRAFPLGRGVLQTVEQDRLGVERTLAGLFASPETKIDEAARRELLGGGKRLRPLLTCAMLRALGQDPTPHLKHVVSVELAHTGSLMHDDIIDLARTRRGMQAAHLAFDVPTAVLAGDSLVVLALELLAHGAPSGLMAAMCEAIRELCAGESLERQYRFDDEVGLDQCRRVNRLKTASLIGYAARAGAILAGAAPGEQRAAHRFGTALGEAFQIHDDLLDFNGDSLELGKPIGQDLEMGIVTVPLALALEEDRELIETVRAYWKAVREGLDARPLFASIRRRIEEVGAFDATRRLAAEDTNRALAALEELPRNRWRGHLRTFSLGMLERVK
jgi:octaprenyl-diphosphate synthase